MSNKVSGKKIVKISKSEATKLIFEIESNSNSKRGVIKLGRFYYDITNSNEKDVLDFIKQSQIRAINKMGATRL